MIYLKHFLLYAIIKNYKFKTDELKNVERLVEQTAKVIVLLEWTRNVHFCTTCER